MFRPIVWSPSGELSTMHLATYRHLILTHTEICNCNHGFMYTGAYIICRNAWPHFMIKYNVMCRWHTYYLVTCTAKTGRLNKVLQKSHFMFYRS
jgi:hypothetical protein